MTYSSNLVEKLLSSVGLQPTSLRRDAHSADKWVVTVGVDQIEVPHYIHAPRFSLNGKEKGNSKVLVTVPKRWTEYEHCRSVNHRSHKCANKKRKQHEQYVPPHQSQTNAENAWTKPKQSKTYKPKQKQIKASQAQEPLPTLNRFSSPMLNVTSFDVDTESETAGDDDDFLSVASTPNMESPSDLFRRPPPGSFDFSRGSINPRKASLRKKTTKKEAVKEKAATPSVSGSQKGVTSWFQATPGKRGRKAKTPRSEPPAKPSTKEFESGKKRPVVARNENSKRTRIVSPTTNAPNERLNLVIEPSKNPLTDKPSAPSNNVHERSDVVQSSYPEADALLAGGGLMPPPIPVGTLGAGTDTGQSSQGSVYDDSQCESKNTNEEITVTHF